VDVCYGPTDRIPTATAVMVTLVMCTPTVRAMTDRKVIRCVSAKVALVYPPRRSGAS